jgi:hypothetical protein
MAHSEGYSLKKEETQMKQFDLGWLSAAELLLPDLTRELQEANQKLLIPGKIEAVCIHEAGHLVFFKKAKIRTVLRQPALKYSQTHKKFVPVLAAVGTPEINEDTAYDEELLDNLARGGVAAGMFVDEFIANKKDYGPVSDALIFELLQEREIVNNNDKDTFTQYCDWAMRNGSGIEFDPVTPWSKAQEHVEAYMHCPEFKEKRSAAIAEIKLECFGLDKF